MVEKALVSALAFDPDYPTKAYGRNGGKHFDSYICDVMWNRCPDWLRSKAEGNGDRRYGNDNRTVLSPMEDEADHDFDFGKLISERRVARWQMTADRLGWSLEEFVVITLDRATKEIGMAA